MDHTYTISLRTKYSNLVHFDEFSFILLYFIGVTHRLLFSGRWYCNFTFLSFTIFILVPELKKKRRKNKTKEKQSTRSYSVIQFGFGSVPSDAVTVCWYCVMPINDLASNLIAKATSTIIAYLSFNSFILVVCLFERDVHVFVVGADSF